MFVFTLRLLALGVLFVPQDDATTTVTTTPPVPDPCYGVCAGVYNFTSTLHRITRDSSMDLGSSCRAVQTFADTMACMLEAGDCAEDWKNITTNRDLCSKIGVNVMEHRTFEAYTLNTCHMCTQLQGAVRIGVYYHEGKSACEERCNASSLCQAYDFDATRESPFCRTYRRCQPSHQERLHCGWTVYEKPWLAHLGPAADVDDTELSAPLVGSNGAGQTRPTNSLVDEQSVLAESLEDVSGRGNLTGTVLLVSASVRSAKAGMWALIFSAAYVMRNLA